MLVTIAQALFFFLPAYIANMFPVVFGNLPSLQRLKKPIDGGRKLGRMAVFGEHKTYFGFIVGVTGAVAVAILQLLLFDYVPGARWIFLFSYSFSSAVLLGFLLGFGSLLGDLVKSFFKRRYSVPSGAPFFPFDQLDFVVGGLFLGSFLYFPSWDHVLALVFLTPLLHLVSNVMGFKLGLKKVWW